MAAANGDGNGEGKTKGRGERERRIERWMMVMVTMTVMRVRWMKGGESHEGQKGLRSADDDGWAMAQEEAADCPSDPPAAFGQRSGDNDHWVQHKDNDNAFAP